MQAEELLSPRPEGLFCKPGGFYIDPIMPVDKAFVTHGHSDHARAGHGAVLATQRTLDIMGIRYGEDFCGSTQAAVLGETIVVNGVRVTFYPAGHVLGSAQIAVEADGMRIVVSGDYKRSPDPTCEAFEPVVCDVFITEATFGLPVFRHPDPEREIGKLLSSLRMFPERTHMVGAYALGKAQRVIALLRRQGYDAPIYIHGSLARICDCYQHEGIELGPLLPATSDKINRDDLRGAVVIGPPSSFSDRWARRFADPITAFASGWMLVRQRIKQRGVELPLVISDHCDWNELTATISEIRPQEVWVTHGREEALIRWCELAGIAAKPLHLVGYEDEGD